MRPSAPVLGARFRVRTPAAVSTSQPMMPIYSPTCLAVQAVTGLTPLGGMVAHCSSGVEDVHFAWEAMP